MTMPLPFVIDNLAYRLVDTLNDLLGQSAGKPLDIATAYFSISGYRIVKDGLYKLGAFRLLLGSDPQSGADVGLKVDPNALKARFKGDLEAGPFIQETLKLVEDLITYPIHQLSASPIRSTTVSRNVWSWKLLLVR
jgi:hypothetical protein